MRSNTEYVNTTVSAHSWLCIQTYIKLRISNRHYRDKVNGTKPRKFIFKFLFFKIDYVVTKKGSLVTEVAALKMTRNLHFFLVINNLP